MVDPIEELVERWQRNPNPAATVALCDALRADPRGALVQQVGDFAKERHASDVSVMLSVARMYIEASQFAEAQNVLVAAGKQAPREASVYRWLGEVLLRRGDAERAEKVLQRAIELGSREPEARQWLERARSYRAMQASAGVRAVAAEVAHAVRPKPRPAVPALPRFTSDIDGDETATTEVIERVETGELEIAPHAPAPTGPAVPGRLDAHLPVATNGSAAMNEEPTVAPRRAATRSPRAAAPAGADAPSVPHPRDVLDALALAGVFEAQTPSTSAAAWAQAGRGPRRKGAPTLVAGMILFVAGSVGVYQAYRHKRAEEHVQAEALLATVEADLHAGRPDALPETEKRLARAFQLESRSPRAALDWARERALVGILKGGADVAFEDAMTRAKEMGVPEEQYAFARVASFLLQGDTAGAAAVLPRWERAAAGDAWFQLVAGATLERAGDARARDRYAAAASLDPELYAARIALARVAAIDGDAQESAKMARALRVATPDRAEPVALVALAWGRDPKREETPPPPEVDELGRREAELPSGLRFVPRAIAALVALDRRGGADVRAEVRGGLAASESPGAAVWLGTISLPLGDEALSRKAALAALQLSAAYEPARALAARVALLGGRVDEALKATEDLDASAPEVAVVRAASAYERADADGLERALGALPPTARKLPFVAPLDLATDALSGRLRLDAGKLIALAGDDAPWGDLVAIDVALDAGDLSSADKIAAAWGKDVESQPLRAVRLARLARYEGRLDAAETLSQAATVHGTVTPRVLLERVYTLVARGRAAEVAPLLARYPLVLGPVATWLSAYAAASSGAPDAAKGKTASLDPPPPTAPLASRVAAAAAFGAMKDRRRGGDYVREVLSSGSLHPDLVTAAVALGFRKVEHGRRPPTYEP